MKKSLLKPRSLKPESKVAIVSPAWGGPGAFPVRYMAGKQALSETLEVEVVEMPNTLRDPDWLENNPEARAEDLMMAFSDDSISAIFSTIGGEDSIRLLPYLDLNVIQEHPKIFLGCSDISTIVFACFKAGLISFYGPSIMTSFAEPGGMFHYTLDSIRRVLSSTTPIGVVGPCEEGWTNEGQDWEVPVAKQPPRKLFAREPWRFLQGTGRKRGRLLGGCVITMETLMSTSLWPALPEWEGAILFLETSEETHHPSALRVFLEKLGELGILQCLGGILFGRPGDRVPLEEFAGFDQELVNVVADQFGLKHLPIVTRMDFGHTDPVMVLPVGLNVVIDCERQAIFFSEAAVTP